MKWISMLTFFDHDKKRLHLKLEMIEKKTKKVSASIEMAFFIC